MKHMRGAIGGIFRNVGGIIPEGRRKDCAPCGVPAFTRRGLLNLNTIMRHRTLADPKQCAE